MLPYMIYKSYMFDVPWLDAPILMPFFCYLLSCMFMLHCYWFSIFIRILIGFLKEGKGEDL